MSNRCKQALRLKGTGSALLEVMLAFAPNTIRSKRKRPS